MACPQIITGREFLSRTLAHIDCQAQVIGSYGYQALGQPGSTASILVSALLTIFIALFGIRLMFGPSPKARDAVFDVLKIGIVLSLAFSWPAFRTVIYDVTLKGPAQIASVVQTSSGNGGASFFVERLQSADDAVVRLTTLGSGRNAGALIENEGSASTFEAAAIQDDTAYGSARILYLASTIGALGLLRIGAGLLLALTPVVAGLLLFTQSRGIFAGWLKGLLFTFAGSVGATLVLAVQLAIIEPWLADALSVRGLGYATPAAPTELLAITLAFALVQLAMLWLLAKILFYRGWLTLPDLPEPLQPLTGDRQAPLVERQRAEPIVLRAERISNSIEKSIRRERQISNQRFDQTSVVTTSGGQRIGGGAVESARLGNSYRRSNLRRSRAATMRDQQ